MTLTELKLRFRISDVPTWKVARLIGMSDTYLSLMLSDRRRLPDHFIERTSAALDLYELAYTKSQDAETKVLKKWPQISKRYQ